MEAIGNKLIYVGTAGEDFRMALNILIMCLSGLVWLGFLSQSQYCEVAHLGTGY